VHKLSCECFCNLLWYLLNYTSNGGCYKRALVKGLDAIGILPGMGCGPLVMGKMHFMYLASEQIHSITGDICTKLTTFHVKTLTQCLLLKRL